MKLFTVVVYLDKRQKQVLSSYAREVPKNALFKLHRFSSPPTPEPTPLPPPPEIALTGK